jgi:hypothetical protein
MTVDRTCLKHAIASKLDAIASEHPMGHQNAYARRYILTTKGGKHLELMFEQSPKTPANIWFEQVHAGRLTSSSIKQRTSLASGLHTTIGKTGETQYGRHSALENMPQLGKADLICMQPETLAEADSILDHLMAV